MKFFATLLGLFFLQGTYANKAINDECINATIIPSNEGVTSNYTTAPVNLTSASKNPSDPLTNCTFFSFEDPKGTDGVTLWYSWKPSITGTYKFSTEGSTTNFTDGGDVSEIESNIGLFKGSACDSIEQITCGYGRIQSILLNADEQYYIKVGFTPYDNGALILTVKPVPPPPENSKCISAITVDPLSGEEIIGDITSAVFDEAAFNCFSSLSKGLWYKITNPVDSPLLITVSTCSEQTEFDTVVSVFEGSDCDFLSCVGSLDDGSGCGLQENFDFLASNLATYYILVQSASDDDEGKFSLTFDSTQSYFNLIDSETDEVLGLLGNIVSYGSVSPKLNIEAVLPGESSIGSVRVTFDNPVRSFCEEESPYSVFWDTNGNYFDASIPVGKHTVSATSFTDAGCGVGSELNSISKEFEVFGCSVEYYIYDVKTQCFATNLYEGSLFANLLDSIPCDVSIIILPFCAFEIETVKLELRNTITDKVVVSRTESTEPYFLYGNDEEDAVSGSIDPGAYILTATINAIEHAPVSFTVLGACENL